MSSQSIRFEIVYDMSDLIQFLLPVSSYEHHDAENDKSFAPEGSVALAFIERLPTPLSTDSVLLSLAQNHFKWVLELKSHKL